MRSSVHNMLHLRTHSAQFPIELCQERSNSGKEKNIHTRKSNACMELLGKSVAAKKYSGLSNTN